MQCFTMEIYQKLMNLYKESCFEKSMKFIINSKILFNLFPMRPTTDLWVFTRDRMTSDAVSFYGNNLQSVNESLF